MSSSTSLLRGLMRIAGPAILHSLLHTLVFLVDRAMLGRFSEAALASLQITSTLIWIVESTLMTLAIGAVAVAGRAVGARDRSTAVAATRSILLVSTVAGVVGGGGLWLAMEPIHDLFPEASGETVAASQAYLSIILPCLPILLVTLSAGQVLAAAGDTRTPLLAGVLGNVLNVALNAVLIFGLFGAPRMGVRGAAIGSVAALSLQLLLLLAWLGRRGGLVGWRAPLGVRVPELYPVIRRVLAVSGPAMLERVVQHSGTAGYVLMIGYLGSEAMAANQALLGIEAVGFLSADGFAIAAAALVAQRLGADDQGAASRAGWYAAAMAGALLMLVGFAFFVAPATWVGAFTADAELVELAVPCLLVAGVAQPFMGVAIVLGQALRGAGATRAPLGAALVGGVIVRLGVTYFASFQLDLGLLGAWLGSTADWVFRVLWLSPVFAWGRWQFTRV